MRSPTYALIWEQWRQVRIPILFSLLLTTLASWTLRQIMELSLEPNRKWLQADSADWGDASTVLAGICMILVMAALLFAHSSTRDLRMGLPARMLTVPISSLHLAVTQIVFRLVAVALVALAIGLALTLIDSWYAQMIAPLVGVSVLAYAYASLVATTIGKRNPVIAFVAIVFTISPVIASLLALEHLLGNSGGSSFHVFGVFVAVCVALSIYRFATVRSTAPVQVLLLTREVGPLYRTSRREDAAQYKFGWRRLAWLYPISMGGLFFMFGLPTLFLGPDVRSSEQFIYAAFLAGPPVAAFIVGMLLIALEHRDSVTGVARFMWTRPTTVQQVVLSRMKIIGLSILYTYLFIGAVTFLAALITGELSNIKVVELLLTLWGFAAILIIAWSFVWAPFIPIVYLLIITTTVNLGGLFHKSEFVQYHLTLGISETVYWTVLVTLAIACARRKIFDQRVNVSFAVVCGALAFVVLGIFFGFAPTMGLVLNMDEVVLLGLTLCTSPLFALLWQGFFLDRVRHGALFRRLPARDS